MSGEANEQPTGSSGEQQPHHKPLPSDILQHMINFLRQHGLTATEEMLSREAGHLLPRNPQGEAVVHASKADLYILSAAVMDEFTAFLAHIDAAFDYFQAEFALLLFPVFAHCYLKLLLDGNTTLAVTFMEKFAVRTPATYEEQTKELSLLRSAEHVMHNEYAQQLLKNKFVVKLSKSALKQTEPLLNRLPFIATIIKDKIELESSESISKQRATVDWQIGGLLGQVSKTEVRRHKMMYGIPREECIAPLEKRRFKTKDESKRRELNAPLLDRIPLPPISEALRIERARALKEFSALAVLGPEQPPSVCLYTTMNAHGGVSSCDVSDDSAFIALGFGDSGISVFALNEHNKLRRLKSGDELEKLDGEAEEVVEEMFDETSAAGSMSLVGHSGTVYSLHFSPCKRLLLSSAADRSLRLWSMATHSNAVCIRVDAPIWQAVFCQRGYYYATASAAGTAGLWATDRMQPLRLWAEPHSHVSSVHFHPNSNYIAAGSDDRYVRIFDVLSASCVRTFAGHRAPVRAVKFSPCGRYLSSVSSDGVLCVWDVAAQRLVGAETRQHATTVPSLAYSREGGTLAVTRGGPSISLYSMDNLVMATSFQAADYTYDPKIDLPDFETQTFVTKQTPVVGLHFTRRNLLLGIGAFNQ